MKLLSATRSALRHLKTNRPNSILQFLLIANALILSTLAVWSIVGYDAATRQNASVQKALEDFSRQFPPLPANASALKLEQLRAKLGMKPLISGTKTQHGFPPSAPATKAYEAVRQPIRNYLEAQITQPADRTTPPPAAIQRYLAQHQTDLAAIQTHLLTQTTPAWEFLDVQQVDFSTPLPSGLSLLSLHQILLLDALEQQRLGRSPAAFDRLVASVKLNQALTQRPDLISQLVGIIVARLQAGVLRRLDRLPPNWQQRLAIPDGRPAFLNALKFEAFISFKSIREYPAQKWIEAMQGFGTGSDNSGNMIASPLAKILQPVQQPYFTLSAADSWQHAQQVHQTLPPPNICRFDAKAVAESVERSLPWWNVLGRQDTGRFLNQWYKVGKREIQWELSQKVVQVKQVIRKTQQIPTTVPGLAASTVCPELRWTYQVAPDGTVSIRLSNPPAWLTQNKSDLPLSHRFNGKVLAKAQRASTK